MKNLYTVALLFFVSWMTIMFLWMLFFWYIKKWWKEISSINSINGSWKQDTVFKQNITIKTWSIDIGKIENTFRQDKNVKNFIKSLLDEFPDYSSQEKVYIIKELDGNNSDDIEHTATFLYHVYYKPLIRKYFSQEECIKYLLSSTWSLETIIFPKDFLKETVINSPYFLTDIGDNFQFYKDKSITRQENIDSLVISKLSIALTFFMRTKSAWIDAIVDSLSCENTSESRRWRCLSIIEAIKNKDVNKVKELYSTTSKNINIAHLYTYYAMGSTNREEFINQLCYKN